jgi:hypothetical protein
MAPRDSKAWAGRCAPFHSFAMLSWPALTSGAAINGAFMKLSRGSDMAAGRTACAPVNTRVGTAVTAPPGRR